MYGQCLRPAILSLSLGLYMMKINILFLHRALLLFSVAKLLRKSGNSVELNGRNLLKLRAFVQRGHDRAMLDARFLCGS